MTKQYAKFKTQLNQKFPTIEIISSAQSKSKTVTLHCCRCNHQWRTTQDIVLHKGCLKCARIQRWQQQLLKYNSHITIIDFTRDNAQYIYEFQCNRCLQTWKKHIVFTPKSWATACRCPHCDTTHTHEQFVAKVKHINPHIEVTSLYIHSQKPITVRFHPCNHTYTYSAANTITKPRKQCPICFCNNRSNNGKQVFMEHLNMSFPNIMPITEYISYKQPITVQCVQCNSIWTTTPNNLFHSHGCKTCHNNQKTYTFQNTILSKIQALQNINLVGFSHTDATVKCKLCKRTWKITYNTVQNENVWECTRCNRIQQKVQQYAQLVHCNVNATHDRNKFVFECHECHHQWELSLTTIYDYVRQQKYNICKTCNTRQSTLENKKLLQQIMHHDPTLIPIIEAYLEEQHTGVPMQLNHNKIAPLLHTKTTTQEGVQSKFVEKLHGIFPHLNLLSTYTNSRSKVTIQCEICNHTWTQIAANLLRGNGCRICYGTEQRTNKFITYMSEHYPHIELLSKYTYSYEAIKVLCHKCHRQFTSIAAQLKRQGCPQCDKQHHAIQKTPQQLFIITESTGTHKRLECTICNNTFDVDPDTDIKTITCPRCHSTVGYIKRRFLSHRQFVEKLSLITNKIRVLGIYQRTNQKIQVQCADCGNIWDTKPQHLLQGCACPQCNGGYIYGTKKKTQEKFVDELQNNFPYLHIISPYHGSAQNIEVYCDICNTILRTNASYILHHGCNHSTQDNMSTGERIIYQYLQQNNIPHYYQYKFPDCKDKAPLPFDFAINNNNNISGIIEYDGEQHCKPVFGNSKQEKWRLFALIKIHDQIKNDYCKQHNIPLLRINFYNQNQNIMTETIHSEIDKFIHQIL